MAGHRPRRTHADFLEAATDAYAAHHAALKATAKRAADEWKRRTDAQALVATVRNNRNDVGQPANPTER